MENYICAYEFQVNKPNGDVDFITVYDLPKHIAFKFVQNMNPDSVVSYYDEFLMFN